MTKDGKVPVHYIESFPLIGWEQKECAGGGTTNFRGDRDVSKCRRPHSTRCPACGQTVKLKKDGRIKAHDLKDGRECAVSKDNRRRSSPSRRR